MNIADRILYLRKSKGISQEELADKVGVSRQAVSKWESEQSMPLLSTPRSLPFLMCLPPGRSESCSAVGT